MTKLVFKPNLSIYCVVLASAVLLLLLGVSIPLEESRFDDAIVFGAVILSAHLLFALVLFLHGTNLKRSGVGIEIKGKRTVLISCLHQKRIEWTASKLLISQLPWGIFCIQTENQQEIVYAWHRLTEDEKLDLVSECTKHNIELYQSNFTFMHALIYIFGLITGFPAGPSLSTEFQLAKKLN